MGMPDIYDRDCEICGCFGGKQVTFCEECLRDTIKEHLKHINDEDVNNLIKELGCSHSS